MHSPVQQTPPAIGRTFTVADDRRGCPGTALLSYGFWLREYGGRADVVGKTISLDNHPFEILEVLQIRRWVLLGWCRV